MSILLGIEQIGKKFSFYILGKKIFSIHFKSKYDKLYAKRFDGLTDEEIEYCVKKQFKKCHGYYPNLKNPKTFNEKMTWEKLYYRNPLMTTCADKVKARDYYCEKVENGESHLVKQYGVYTSPNKIDFDSLPQSFVLKSNWGSGRQIIVKDKDNIDIEEIKKVTTTWMRIETNHYFRTFETGYKDIMPKIICEEFLNFKYKLEFFCFNGVPKFFWIVLNDKTANTKANYYNLNWEKLDVSNHYPNFRQTIEKPACFEELIEDAKKMSGDFPFVRCDFYVTKDGYRFSEMTFFHWAGLKKYEPIEWDEKIGNLMELPIKDCVKE